VRRSDRVGSTQPEQTSNIMYFRIKRIISYFPNTDMEAKGKAGSGRIENARAVPRQARPRRLREPYVPERATASGRTRKTLKGLTTFCASGGGGKKRDGSGADAASEAAERSRFLDSNARSSRTRFVHTEHRASLASRRTIAFVDPASVQSVPTSLISTSSHGRRVETLTARR